MDKRIYMHGIYAKSEIYDSKRTLSILKSILTSRALLSARLQGKKEAIVYFNGQDYISLCDYEKRDLPSPVGANAFEGYVRCSLSLIFPKDRFEVITPEMVTVPYNNKYYETIKLYGMSETTRYSDMPDEVQVKDKISLSHLTGVTLPVQRMQTIFTTERRMVDKVLREVDNIGTLLDEHNYSVPIYDVDTFEPLANAEDVKRLVKYHRNRG